jgi:hypothetical protein
MNAAINGTVVLQSTDTFTRVIKQLALLTYQALESYKPNYG